jgi:hypothetical protein
MHVNLTFFHKVARKELANPITVLVAVSIDSFSSCLSIGQLAPSLEKILEKRDSGIPCVLFSAG